MLLMDVWDVMVKRFLNDLLQHDGSQDMKLLKRLFLEGNNSSFHVLVVSQSFVHSDDKIF